MTYRIIVGALTGIVVSGALVTGTMAADYKIVDGTIPQSLTGKAGDPVQGKKTAVNRKKRQLLGMPCYANSRRTVPRRSGT